EAQAYCTFGSTSTCAGRTSAPGPGKPVVVSIAGEPVASMQKVVANTAVPPSVAGVPVRVMLPPPFVVKQGVLVLFEQQAWEMPPLMSTQLTPLPLTQAVPVQAPGVQVPAPQLSSCVCGAPVVLSGQGLEPDLVAVPVVRLSGMSRVAAAPPDGVQLLDRV